ncbi:Density-regulated protein [Entamoeba histolytica HM-3:IMSS]|uniref:Density-regulated protein, putative n=2 Tax=Entamoeba histolytica TaxID=5759 RepID=M2SA80_ENTHI|nr:density-regulated protein, putative [Entamoeba histolytica KU27]EMS13533.1 Density-regulated protein [Entamoeba histolytica HM-3:IMSS]
MSEEKKYYTKVEIDLCPLCHLPKDLCPYGPNAAKCTKAQTTESKTEEQSNEEKKGESKDEQQPTESKETTKKEVKKGKEQKKVIKIMNVKRNKKQSVTKIVGVLQFGLKQQDVSKFVSKKFSVGANIDKTVGVDCINVQGDFVHEIADILAEQFKIDPANIEC